MASWEEELNNELNDVQKHKPPISASRVSSITKLAYKHIKYSNDIAFMIENFLELAKPEYKLAALYLIDSICKAKKQSDRDAYIKRFSQNIENTVNRVLDCTEKDKEAVKKVINLWITQKVFSDNILQTVAQVIQQRTGAAPSGITIQPIQTAVGFDPKALLATIASQTNPLPAVNYYNPNTSANMQSQVGLGAPISTYANAGSVQYNGYGAAGSGLNTVLTTPVAVQPKPAQLDSALFDIYDDLEDDEQRIAEQKKRREEEEQKRREEQEKLLNMSSNTATQAADQSFMVPPTHSQGGPQPATVIQSQGAGSTLHAPAPLSGMQQHGAMPQHGANTVPAASYQQSSHIQSQSGLPPPPNTYQPSPVHQQVPSNMGRGGGYAQNTQQNSFGQFQDASGNFGGGMQQGFNGGANQFNNGAPVPYNGPAPPHMQGKRPMGRGRGFNNFNVDPSQLPTGDPVGNNMLKNKSRILFVGNLAPTVTEELLGKIYSKYTGEAKIRYLAPKHMAFVAFSDRAIAEKAKEETHGKFLEGRDLKVGWAMEFKGADDFDRETGESTVPSNAISMYRADQFVVLTYNPDDVIPLENPRSGGGRGRGGFGRGGGDFSAGRGRGGGGRGRGLQSFGDTSSGYGNRFQGQWSHPQQSGGDDGSDYQVKLTGGEGDKGAKGGNSNAAYGYENYYEGYGYYGGADQDYYQQYYAGGAADPYANAAGAAKSSGADDQTRAASSGNTSSASKSRRTRSRSRSRDRRRSRSRSRDRRSGGRRRSRSRSRSRSRDRDNKRRKTDSGR